MAYRWLTELADVLRDAGLEVEEVAGWKKRGHPAKAIGPMEEPQSILVHHTATSASAKGDYPSLGIVRDGHSNLAGPLSQLGLGRSGKWYVIAAGVCYHAGPTKDAAYRNVRSIGIEAEHPGGSAPWPKAQYDSYVKGVAALQAHFKKVGNRVAGHKEQTAGKPDPNFDMAKFRSAVKAAANAGADTGTKPPSKPSKAVTIDSFDGTLGPNTIRAWQTYYHKLGRIGKSSIDGVISSPSNTILEVQRDLKGIGAYGGALDGYLGPQTWAGLRRRFKASDDRRAVQALQFDLWKRGLIK